MDIIYIISDFEKIFIISIYTYLTYIKFTNHTESRFKDIFLVIIFSLIIATIYINIIQYILPIFAIQIVCLTLGSIFTKLLNQKFHYCMLGTIISFLSTYIIYWISVIVSGILLLIMAPNIDYRNPISLLIIPLIMILLFSIFSKIKRVKNGLNFLKNIESVNTVGKFVNILFIIATIMFRIITRFETIYVKLFCCLGNNFYVSNVYNLDSISNYQTLQEKYERPHN